MSAGIRLEDLTVSYDGEPAVQGVFGVFEPGTLTAIIGANGAGKTTLLKAIAGMAKPANGRVERFDLHARDIAYLPQQVEIDRSFPISVMETVMIGLWRRVGLFRAVTGSLRREVQHALDAVGLNGFARRAIGSLSAGQFQRVLFARTILQDCPVILLDEPFTAIDARTTADLLGVVHDWHQERRTVIAVLHDFEQVRAHFPRTLLLAREAVEWGDTASVMQPERLIRAGAKAVGWEMPEDAYQRASA